MAEVTFRRVVKEGGAMLFRLAHSLAVAEDSEIRCCGVTTCQALALLATKSGSQVTMSQVGEAIGVSAGTATRVIDNLVREGLVERARNSSDRRQVCIRPTSRGKKRIKELDKCYDQFWQTIFGKVPKKRLPETLRALRLLVPAVEEAREGCRLAP